MNDYDRQPEKLETLAAIVLGSVIILAVLFCFLGCASTPTCPPCDPIVEKIEVKIPVRYCEPPPSIEDLVLPPWPTLPESPNEDQLKAWYAECVSTVRIREQILALRVQMLMDTLEGYRE